MRSHIYGVLVVLVDVQCTMLKNLTLFTLRRWDLQHYRAKKQREELQEKYKQREEARLKGRKGIEHEQTSCDETLLPDCFRSELILLSQATQKSRLTNCLGKCEVRHVYE